LTRALAAPLVPAATVAAACAAASLVHPLAGPLLALIVLAAVLPLARASADRPRRVLWWSIAVTAAGTALRVLVPPPGLAIVLDPRLDALRVVLAEPLRSLVPEPESAIVTGIVLGDRTGIARDLRDAFAATGTAHLLAISGSNMSLVAAAVAVALRGHARPIIVAAAAVAAVAGYSLLVGPSPSVVRAALMAAVASLGLALGRRGAAANALGAAVVAMLLLDPRALEDVGFLLSVSATAGLIAWERPLAERMRALPGALGHALAATLAASLPTIPIVAAVFGRVSLISPLANLVAVPLFAPIVLFGAATSIAGAIAPAAAGPLAIAAFACSWALRRWVELGAGLPLASIAVPGGPLTAAVVAASLVIACAAAPRAVGVLRAVAAPRVTISMPAARRARVMPAAVAIAVVVASAVLTSSLGRAGGFRLHALDVGQGDAFLLESDGRYALIDGGPDGALLLRRLGEIIPAWHRRIDLVALTHEHADHGAGLLAAIDRYDIGLAIEPAGMGDVPLVRMWSDRLARSGAQRRALAEGAVVRLGAVTIAVLAPGRGRPFDVPSLVMRASRGSGSVLFMGDATDDQIADLLLAPERLAARVYVPPHHGADTTHANALAAAVRAEFAVISVGALNRYGHPTPATLAALEEIPVYRTDRYGTVDLALDAHPIVVHAAKARIPPDRGGPVPGAAATR
jgi:competence protein ComEC